MTREEAIKFLQQLYPNGGHCWLDEQRIEAIGIAVKALQEEPVSRTPADIEAAMQEVEEKSKAFTEAHQGEESDTILAQMRGEELVSEDLEQFATEYAEAHHVSGKSEFAKAVKIGANWQKDLMMKEAIETTIVDDWIYGKDPDNSIRPAIYQRIEEYKVGDKVKIVVIKED